MISAFLGEFLFHPCGLELSFYRCTNNCAYCFANTKGGEERDPQLKSIDSFIRTARTRKTLEADLFNEGFPICISNNSDPFTKKNYNIADQFVRLLNNFPNGIYFQTKCAYGVEEILDAIGDRRDRVFYITMTCADDAVSKMVEPGAPVIGERIRLAKLLASEGFPVVIGFNPYCIRWMPLPALVDICEELAEAGIVDYFFQPIKLSGRRFRELPAGRQARFSGFQTGDDVIEYCKSDERWIDTLTAITTVAELVDDAIPTTAQMLYNSPFNLYQEVFHQTMPLSSEFGNWCLDNPQEVYTFEDFQSVVFAHNQEFWDRPHNGIDRYVIALTRDLWRGHPENQKMTSFKKLLRLMWNNPHKFFVVPGASLEMEPAGKDKNGNLLIRMQEEPETSED